MRDSLMALLSFWLAGCAMSPIPSDIEEMHDRAARDAALLRPVLQQGDIIFRLSNTSVAGNLINFSRSVAKLSDSEFSHAVLVLSADKNGALLADVTAHGVERRYLIDWHMDCSSNIVVKRLRPEYRYLIPKVMQELENVVESDNLYDRRFTPDDDVFYCTELVDHVFRKLDHPLAKRIRVNQLPHYNLFVAICCGIGGINVDNEVVVVGNDKIGLFSSPMLETVIDLRPSAIATAAASKPKAPPVSAIVKRPSYQLSNADLH